MQLRRVIVALGLSLTACAKADDTDTQSSPAPAAASATPVPSPDLARVDGARQMGQSTAKVWFIMASDFQCPFCRSFHDETWPRIEREYVQTGKIRVAFMNHPMPFHGRAVPAAEAAMCAGAQDRFWQMHDSLFINQDKWVRGDAPALFEGYAKGLGLDVGAWKSCMDTHATRTMIEADNARTSQVGVTGTPGFIIGNQLAVVGAEPYPVFKKALDDALARAGK